ncbi:hypothetical protein OB931_05755 [Aeromonas media]|uniref:hypothetical protein n=1 Tax=Aeromonas media TaxID=651 RepID=UPI0024C1B412|nr:hypothetical protein [Aeromonas media]MDM5075894.1 hypothetical protein [Aeromonas media]
MQVSRRSKFSLAQLLSVIDKPTVYVIFDKFGFTPQAVVSPAEIADEILAASDTILSDVILEVVQTARTLRNKTSPKYQFDDQFSILEKSLLLDGYQIEGNLVKALDPNFVGKEAVEDALFKEVQASSIVNKKDILDAIKCSADDFVKAQPDYNGSLTNIRILLETLVREIAFNKGFATTKSGNAWGTSLNYLKMNGFIDQKDENALSSVYTFISNGAHIPLGFSQEEFVRLGRNLCYSMCYFVIKKFNT